MKKDKDKCRFRKKINIESFVQGLQKDQAGIWRAKKTARISYPKDGSRVKIQNNVSVYDEVEIEDDVFCGPSIVFTNVYNPWAAISREHEYRKTLVKKGATIGANATIICGVTLGEYCFIGAGAVVNRDVKPCALMVGVPGRQAGWMSRLGERLSLPLSGNAQAICRHTQTKYRTQAGELITEATQG